MAQRRIWQTVLALSGIILVASLFMIVGFLPVSASSKWLYLLASFSATTFGTAAYQLRKMQAFLSSHEAAGLAASGNPDDRGVLGILDGDDD